MDLKKVSEVVIGLAVVAAIGGLVWKGDSHWLPRSEAAAFVSPLVAEVAVTKSEFSNYLQAQTKAEARSLDRRIIDVQGELQYADLTPERRAQLELTLQTLLAQKAEIDRDLEQ